jgi:hypothetical protein
LWSLTSRLTRLPSEPELVTSSATARFRILAGAGSSRTAAAVFAACGGLLAFFWALVMQLAVPTVKLGLLASTRCVGTTDRRRCEAVASRALTRDVHICSKHPVLLNERYIIVILSNASLGLAYAVRELWTEAFLPKWPRDILALQGLILGRLASRVPSALGLPVLHSVGFSAVYLALRKPVLRFFLSWFGVLVRCVVRADPCRRRRMLKISDTAGPTLRPSFVRHTSRSTLVFSAGSSFWS